MSGDDVEALARILCYARTATGPVMGREMTWEECGYQGMFLTWARVVLASAWYAERVAEAWDEGYRKGADDALISDDTRAEFNRKRHANPYRAPGRGDDS